MTTKKLSIIAASIVIPVVVFGVFIGTTDFMKENSLDLSGNDVIVAQHVRSASPLADSCLDFDKRGRLSYETWRAEKN